MVIVVGAVVSVVIMVIVVDVFVVVVVVASGGWSKGILGPGIRKFNRRALRRHENLLFRGDFLLCLGLGLGL